MEPRSRKKVKEPPNSKFIRIGDIVTAKEASQKPLKRRQVITRVDPTPVMEEAQEVIYYGLESLRHAEEMQKTCCFIEISKEMDVLWHGYNWGCTWSL